MLDPLKFRWLGVAGIEITANGQTLLADPFFTRPPLHNVLWGRVKPDKDRVFGHIRKGNFILITHSHYDHLLDVPAVVEKTGAVVLGSANTCRLLEICGVPAAGIRQVEVGDNFNLGRFNIRVFPARHVPLPVYRPGRLKDSLQPPLRLIEYRMDQDFSYLIRVGGLRILLWSGNNPDGAHKADILFTNFVIRPSFYRQLLEKVRPSVVIPIHWDNLFQPPVITQKLSGKRFTGLTYTRPKTCARFISRFSPSIITVIPEIFKEYDLNRLVPTRQEIAPPLSE